MRYRLGKLDIRKLKMLINVIMLNRQKNKEINNKNLIDFITRKKEEMEEVKQESLVLNDKILVIISCHTEGRLRFNAINSIMNYLIKLDNIEIVMVNSSNLPLSDIIKKTYINNYIKYFEIANDNYYGFSKWYYGLINIDYSLYKFVTFINDSILIHNNISHFFDYTRVKNVDLFGYNDSNQIRYHYQSYLFSIKTTCIENFIRLLNKYKYLIHSYQDVVNYYELNMIDYFESKDCFLKLTDFESQNGKNIFFTNDVLYMKLRNEGYIPLTKLKRIIA